MPEQSKYEDALKTVAGYYSYKRQSERGAWRPMWFSRFARYAQYPKGIPAAPTSMTAFRAMFSPKGDDVDALANYNASKDPKKTASATDEQAARIRTRVMASIYQTINREFFGADNNPRNSADQHRYEYDRKVASLGLLNRLRELFRKKSNA